MFVLTDHTVNEQTYIIVMNPGDGGVRRGYLEFVGRVELAELRRWYPRDLDWFPARDSPEQSRDRLRACPSGYREDGFLDDLMARESNWRSV